MIRALTHVIADTETFKFHSTVAAPEYQIFGVSYALLAYGFIRLQPDDILIDFHALAVFLLVRTRRRLQKPKRNVNVLLDVYYAVELAGIPGEQILA